MNDGPLVRLQLVARGPQIGHANIRQAAEPRPEVVRLFAVERLEVPAFGAEQLRGGIVLQAEQVDPGVGALGEFPARHVHRLDGRVEVGGSEQERIWNAE